MERLKLRYLLKTVDDRHVVIDTANMHDLNEEYYETMVFVADEAGEVWDYDELDIRRYHDRESAIKGHQEMIEEWKNKNLSDVLREKHIYETVEDLKRYLYSLQQLCNEGKITIDQVIDLINEDDFDEDRKIYVMYKPKHA